MNLFFKFLECLSKIFIFLLCAGYLALLFVFVYYMVKK